MGSLSCICFLGSLVEIDVFVTFIITVHGFIMVNDTGIRGVLTIAYMWVTVKQALCVLQELYKLV